MINPNNLKSLADSLSEVLETPVSEKLLEAISPKQRAFMTTQMANHEVLIEILNQAKKRIGAFPKKPYREQPVKPILQNDLENFNK